VAVILWLVLPALWIDDRGFDALERSRQLVSGYVWSGLGLFVLVVLAAFALVFALAIPALLLPHPAARAVEAFATYLVGTRVSVNTVAAYRRLRAIKDGDGETAAP